MRTQVASLCNGRTKRKWGAMRDLEFGDRIESFYEDSAEATIRATVNCFDTRVASLEVTTPKKQVIRLDATRHSGDKDCQSIAAL